MADAPVDRKARRVSPRPLPPKEYVGQDSLSTWQLPPGEINVNEQYGSRAGNGSRTRFRPCCGLCVDVVFRAYWRCRMEYVGFSRPVRINGIRTVSPVVHCMFSRLLLVDFNRFSGSVVGEYGRNDCAGERCGFFAESSLPTSPGRIPFRYRLPSSISSAFSLRLELESDRKNPVRRRPVPIHALPFVAYYRLSAFGEDVAGVGDARGDVGDSESVIRSEVYEFRACDSGVGADGANESLGLGGHVVEDY